MIRTPDRRVLSFGRRKTFGKGRIQVCKTSHSDEGNSKVNEFKGLYLFWLQNGIVGDHMTLTQGCSFGTSKKTSPLVWAKKLISPIIARKFSPERIFESLF